MFKNIYVTVLAGGLGKRMQCNTPKVLCKIKEEAMIVKIIKQVILLNPIKILLVVGKHKILIKEEIEKNIDDNRIIYVDQITALGTGDAIKSTLIYFNSSIDNIIINGDMPFIRSETILDIYYYYLTNNSKILITAIDLNNPNGNGRIIITNANKLEAIVEEKDCDNDQKLITLVNSGIYICNSEILKKYIPLIENNNIQGEYYLTDLVTIYNSKNRNNVDLYILPKEKINEIYNVNTKSHLDYAQNI